MNNLSDKEKQAVDTLAMELCNEPAMTIEEVQHDPTEDRKKLALYNAAIDALKALCNDGIDDYCAQMDTGNLLERLIKVRMSTFEHMIPWDMIAKGKIK